MPLRHWQERGCAIVAFEGEYDSEAALQAIVEALGSATPVSGLLLDLSESTSFRRRSAEDLRHIASFLSTRRERFGSRLAAVGSTDLAYGLLRMGMVFVSDHGIESEAFRSRAEALGWLCRPGFEDPVP